MGNWRTVHIDGSCPEVELHALRAACSVADNYHNFHCLSVSEGLAGLGDWPATRINAVGNLAERDYSVVDVAEQLRNLVKVAPGLALRVHCGDEYEEKKCVATIEVRDGVVTVLEPEVALIPEISEEMMAGRLMKQLHRPRR